MIYKKDDRALEAHLWLNLTQCYCHFRHNVTMNMMSQGEQCYKGHNVAWECDGDVEER